MPSKKPSMIDALRAKHDPHYQLAGKVEGLEKDLPIQLSKLHKTLSKSFGMQRKTLIRVAGLEGKVKDNETRISNLADALISIGEESRASSQVEEKEQGKEQGIGDWNDEDGEWDRSSITRGAAVGVAEETEEAGGGINGESFLEPETYERFADELQQDGTIAGKQLSPEERKEGFKKSKGKNKIDFEKFVGKVLDKKDSVNGKGKSSTSGKQKLLPGTASPSAAKNVDDISKDPDAKIDEEGEETGNKGVMDFLKNMLDPALIKIEENLDKILGNLEGKVESDKDKAEDIRQAQDDAADDAREAKLESKGKGMIGKSFDKATKPVTSFFDMLLKFFVNVIMGAVVMRIIKIIEKPMRLLDPLFMVINGISKVLNAIHKAMWDLFTGPINWVSEGLSTGINFLIDGINKALGLLKNIGVDFQIPNIQLPTFGEAAQIPMIPMADARQGVAMAGGGEVPGVVTDPKEKKAQEEYMLRFVNEERALQGLEPLKQLTYAQGVELTKMMGPGPKTKETSHTDYDFDNMIKTTTRSKTVGDKSIFGGSVGLLTDKDKEKFLAENPEAAQHVARIDQLGLDALGAAISASAKMNGGGLVQFLNTGGKVAGKGNTDTVPAMLTPGEFVMSKGAVDAIGVENLMAMNKEGGGTNKPELMKFAGGGSVPNPPGPRRKGGTTVLARSGGGGGAGGLASGTSGEGAGVTPFSAKDIRNINIMINKGLYNIMG